MARNFDTGMSERIQTSLGSNGFTNPMTLLAILRKASDGVYLPFLCTGTTAPNGNALSFAASNQIQMYWGSGSPQLSVAEGLIVSDGWTLIGISKASGTVATRFYQCRFGVSGGLRAENSSTTFANMSVPSGSCWLGCDSTTGFFDGDMAIAGVWNVVLSDADVQKLALTYTGSDWLTLPGTPPTAVWQFNQSVAAGVSDLTGNGANQTAVAGTRPSLDPAISVIRAPVYLPFPPRS